MAYTRGEIAQFYYLALRLGLADKHAPIRWADEEILNSNKPDASIIDLSLAAKEPIDTVLSLLNGMRDRLASPASKMIAAILWGKIRLGQLSEAAAANLIYALSNIDDAAISALGPEVGEIDQYFEPWHIGAERAAEAVRKFLRPYEGMALPPV